MKILKIISLSLFVGVLLYFSAMVFRSLGVVDTPSTLSTEHFLISFQGIYQEEAHAVANYLEGNYERVRNALNDPDHEVVHVFIHGTQSDFNNATGLVKSNANGTSRGPNEFHFLWTTWFNSIFPNDPLKTAVHEFTHCVQLNILIKKAQQEFSEEEMKSFDRSFEEKFIRDYPQWFWEAICDYEAGVVNRISIRYAMRKKPTLQSLNTSNQIYNVGYTIIDYIVQKWGADKLPSLITSYVDVENVLAVSESDFEKGWVEYVDNKY
jgi:hypothetical protein